jgi:integrase
MGFRTQREVDRLALPKGKTDAFFFDEEARGLSVRIQGDRRTWVVHYTAAGKRRRASLGDVLTLPLRDARTKAGRIVSDAKDGKDTLVTRRAAAKKGGNTFGPLVTLYITQYAETNQRPRTLVETRRALQKHLRPLHAIELASIGRADVAGLLFKISNSSGPIMANRCRAALSHCFAWAMQQGLADSNPVVGTAKPAPEVKRERVLSEAELVELWHATAGGGDYATIIRLLILLGQRREEVAGLGRAELDLDVPLWSLPGERTKNGLPHVVPLPRQATAMLAAILAKPRKRELLFGEGKGPFSGWSQSKVRLDEQIARARAERRLGRKLAEKEAPSAADAMPAWVLHDLRRSFVTHNNDRGTPPHIVEAIVNHVGGEAKKGVAGTYNKALYLPERKAALQRWADHLERLVSGVTDDNVVSLARAG